jgi:ribose transport system substrate-binding protein
MQAAKPGNVDVRVLKGLWTEESAYNSVASWLKLNVTRDVMFGLVAAQNDAMAMGARGALQELTGGAEQARWLSLPYIGCDGLPNTGQEYVHRGVLAGTVVIPANAGQAVKALDTALRTKQQPQECIFVSPSSYPQLSALAPAVVK